MEKINFVRDKAADVSDVINMELDKRDEIVYNEQDFSLDNDLDISWIEEHEKELNIEQLLLKEPVKEIEIFYIYIKKNGYIENVIKEKQILNDGNNGKRYISKEKVLYMIQKNKNVKNKNKIRKYKLDELLLFHVNVESENIQSFSKIEKFDYVSKENLITIPFFGEIVIPDSLFIFHSIHRIYFVFKEIDKEDIKKVIKPILKKNDKTKKVMDNFSGDGVVHNVTKKVGFSDVVEYDNDNQKNKTRKNLEKN